MGKSDRICPMPGGGELPLSLLVIILIPAGLYFTVRTRFLPDSSVSGYGKSGYRLKKQKKRVLCQSCSP